MRALTGAFSMGRTWEVVWEQEEEQGGEKQEEEQGGEEQEQGAEESDSPRAESPGIQWVQPFLAPDPF